MAFCLLSFCFAFCFYLVGYYSACKEYNRGVNHPTKRILFWIVMGLVSFVGIASIVFKF